ncbi:MAG: M28 family peptidase [Dermatophilaceae bacterium]
MTSASPTTLASPTTSAGFDPQAAYAVVTHLAEGIGPREASGPAYRAAADYVAGRFAALGYQVDRMAFPVPAGVSWGVRVPAGASQNVIATPAGFDPDAPHRLVGAHLDTVPQAPGAEDNGSGVAVLVELARLAAAEHLSVPVVFVAFGAEEPRGSGDTQHHFGSQALVAAMPPAQRAKLAGMLSLDRVGVPTDVLPVCHGGRAAGAVRSALVSAAARAGVPAQACVDRASDHWSFEQAGLDAARIGKVPFDGYHSPGDVPSVVEPAQLQRTAAVAWSWLSSPI